MSRYCDTCAAGFGLPITYIKAIGTCSLCHTIVEVLNTPGDLNVKTRTTTAEN